MLHMGGLQERQQPEENISVSVRQNNGLDTAVIDRGNMDALAFHKPTAEGQTLGGVMVAADDKHLLLFCGKAAQKIVKQGHCLGGGDTFVINVAGDQYGPRLLGIDHVQDLIQDICLLFDHGNFIDPLADV